MKEVERNYLSVTKTLLHFRSNITPLTNFRKIFLSAGGDTAALTRVRTAQNKYHYTVLTELSPS
jgi:hypothetical protein